MASRKPAAVAKTAAPKATAKRCVFYMNEDHYRDLRSRLLRKGTTVTAWIRDRIEAELEKV